jgi:hypothetical protein
MSLKTLIVNSEERLVDYKHLLKDLHTNKEVFKQDDAFVIWYKDYIRELKNEEQLNLKSLVKERTYEKEGLSHPYFYK